MKRHVVWASIATLFVASLPCSSFAQTEEDWYRPSEADLELKPAPPPAPPEPPKKSHLVSLQMPVYSFVAGELEGVATSMRIRYDGDDGGVYLGIYQPGGWADLGLDLNFLGGTSLFSAGPIDVWALFPTTGVHLLTNFKDAVLGLPFTVTGLRVTTCEPVCVVADVRGPTADLLIYPGSDTNAAIALGASLAVGLAF